MKKIKENNKNTCEELRQTYMEANVVRAVVETLTEVNGWSDKI